jgi:hypothetical protein
MRKTVVMGTMRPKMDNKAAANDDAAAIKPQPASHRGMSFD